MTTSRSSNLKKTLTPNPLFWKPRNIHEALIVMAISVMVSFVSGLGRLLFYRSLLFFIVQ